MLLQRYPELRRTRTRCHVDEQRFSGWLDRYKHAWESQDADAAAVLFSENASYQLTPFHEPMIGRKPIRAYWHRVTARGRHIRFVYRVITSTEGVGVADYDANFSRPGPAANIEVHGVLVAEFDEDDLCRRLRLWWHRREHHATF
jgi:hypothetical protein